MQRLATAQLLRWKNRPRRKPVLIDGARQVGKSWLVERLFGARHFAAVHKLDFLAEPRLASIFDGSLAPEQIISNIEILRGISINPANDLIFFDEVGECQRAVDSLKYFAEGLPQAYVCATGSNIGLLDSFPVGKVESLSLYPMCFEEFVLASGNQAAVDAFRTQSRGKAVHEALWPLLLDYYFVGGMPEAVAAWFEDHDSGNTSKLERCQLVKGIHRDLIAGYGREFGKYSGKENARHIEAVFENIPRQLSRVVDGSVKRFRFNDVIAQKRRYAELRGPISWLEKANLASKCHPVESQPAAPLSALARENVFKLYLFDVGLLGYMLELDYLDQLAQKVAYKGFIAENFVHNELRARTGHPTYSWATAHAEIEFLHKCHSGAIIPVEVKSAARTRSRSLRSYMERYAPERTVKLIGAPGNTRDESPNLVWPLYHAQFLADL